MQRERERGRTGGRHDELTLNPREKAGRTQRREVMYRRKADAPASFE